MKILNVCGFNLSGCSAAFDLFYDYEPLGSNNREFHESGFLKCKYTFGGAIQSALLDLPFRPTREELAASLQGDLPATFEGDASNLSIHNHLVSRKSMAKQFGAVFTTFTKQALADIPGDIAVRSKSFALKVYEDAAVKWLTALIEHIPAENFHLNKINDDSIMLFKNDPPGKFPYMAGLIPNGISFSVLRDPVDACFDYNRYYHFGHSEKSVKEYCQIFGSWVRTVKNQLALDIDRAKGKYFVVRFEDLVQKQTVRETMLHIAQLSNANKISSHFQAKESATNVGIGQAMPKNLIDLIQTLCLPEYHSLIAVLKKHGMLIE